MLIKKDLNILSIIEKVYFDLVVKGARGESCRAVHDISVEAGYPLGGCAPKCGTAEVLFVNSICRFVIVYGCRQFLRKQ
jgi:hypothetical protein